jgi:hypothetical protein
MSAENMSYSKEYTDKFAPKEAPGAPDGTEALKKMEEAAEAAAKRAKAEAAGKEEDATGAERLLKNM